MGMVENNYACASKISRGEAYIMLQNVLIILLGSACTTNRLFPTNSPIIPDECPPIISKERTMTSLLFIC